MHPRGGPPLKSFRVSLLCFDHVLEPILVVLGLARKTKSLGGFLRCCIHYHLNIRDIGRRFSASLRDSSGSRSSTRDDSQPVIRSSTFDSTHLPELCRVSSPDSYVPTCTADCPMTLPDMQVKANVVSTSRPLHRNLL
jgi:hypothetical protein